VCLRYPLARKKQYLSPASTFNTERIDHLYQDPHINGVKLFLHYVDISDATNLIELLYRIQPEEIYDLAAQSHVRVSFNIPDIPEM
jgi:GDPmannose 4,6-dehydratase